LKDLATVPTVKTEIEKKITEFYGMNEQTKFLKKKLDPLKEEIKGYFRGIEDTTIIVDEVEAVFAIREGSSSMNSEKLIAKLKKLKRKDLIKKIEVPDLVEVEKLIYNDQGFAKLLADCVVQGSPTEVLTIKKHKAKKQEEDNG
jgi:hypothetical protein